MENQELANGVVAGSTQRKRRETYNGWPNRETWNVMLWMDNVEGAYRFYREKFRENSKRTGDLAKYCAMTAFGEQTPDGVRFDSSRIRWGCIARAMREDLR